IVHPTQRAAWLHHPVFFIVITRDLPLKHGARDPFPVFMMNPLQPRAWRTVQAPARLTPNFFELRADVFHSALGRVSHPKHAGDIFRHLLKQLNGFTEQSGGFLVFLNFLLQASAPLAYRRLQTPVCPAKLRCKPTDGCEGQQTKQRVPCNYPHWSSSGSGGFRQLKSQGYERQKKCYVSTRHPTGYRTA